MALTSDPYDVEGALRRIAEAGDSKPLLTEEEFSAYVSTCLRCRRPFHEHLGVQGVDCKGEFPAVEYHEDGRIFSEDGGQLIAIRAPLSIPPMYPRWKLWLGKALFVLRELLWVVLNPLQFCRDVTYGIRVRFSWFLYEACEKRMAVQHAEMVRTSVLEWSTSRLYAVLLLTTLIGLPFRILSALGLDSVTERFVKWFNHDEE